MTRREYTDRVVACLRGPTKEELEAIRAELDAHIEDHICDLLDLGYDEALAEERAMMWMGDPEEVGRELDKQYPMRWLIVSRAALILTVILCAQALFGIGILSHLWWSLEARIAPNEVASDLGPESREYVDIRVPIGNDILRIYRVAVGTEHGDTVAEVAMCAYDRIPGGIVADLLWDAVTLQDQRGRPQEHTDLGSGKSNYGAVYRNCGIAVKPEDTYITLIYEHLDEYVTVEIPLPQEVTP